MIMDKLKALISEQFGVPEESLTDDTSMVDDLGADSLDFVELMMALEEEFDLEISDTEDVGDVDTLGDIEAYIRNKVE